MDQALALEILINGESALLSGPAGSGKTYLLNRFIRHAKAGGKHVAVTATTGLAASHLGGVTIHAWSGIGINDVLPGDFFQNLPKGRRETLIKSDVLIIDEISMLHDYRLDMVDEVLRRVRDTDKPFGGMQVILCGDFFQLPPVSRAGEPQSSFVVSARVWEEFDPVICYLDEQHRQNDDTYLEILQAMRDNDLRRRHVEHLLNRQTVGESGEDVTELHTTNVDVDAINQRRLEAIDEEPHYYTMRTTGSANYVEGLKRSCLAQELLVLKKGALIMCIKNSQDKKYVNGSLGTVIDFDEDTDYPIVQLVSGKKLTIEPESWELRDGDKKRAGLTQLPLRLAWAITVHKSQGMTLDAARVDLRRAFVEGMGYVALSRVRSLDKLQLVGINRMALKISEEALLIDEGLRKRARADSKRFSHLRDAAQKRKTEKPKKKAASGTWSEKLEKMRQTYPNAYMPWTEADDAALVALFSGGQAVSVKSMTQKLGRHPGSIKARLTKHFGEDAVLAIND